MNRNLLVVVTIGTAFALSDSSAQPANTRLEGTVLTNNMMPAAGATVALIHLADSIKQAITTNDRTGKFGFENIPAGRYCLVVTLIGFEVYQSKELKVVREGNSRIEVGTIILIPSSKNLEEIRVVSRKPFIERKIDKTVLNVNALISATGLNAFEVLEKAPGVVVAQDGAVSYMGKPGVLILVDGKPTYLAGDNLVSYLKSLPASALEQIELMSNPPAKFEAGGTAGVINIRTKRPKTRGFAGTVSSSIGFTSYWRTNHNINLSYANGKTAFFINAGYGFQKTGRDLTLERSYFNGSDQPASVLRQQAYFIPANQTATIKFGLDYFVNLKTTIGIGFNGSASRGTYDNPVHTLVFNSSGLLDSAIVARNTARSRFDNRGINLNILKRLDSSGGTVGVDVDYIAYTARNSQTFENNIYTGTQRFKTTERIWAHLPARIEVYTAKADYNKQVAKGRIEAGAKASSVHTDNVAAYFQLRNNAVAADDENTNRFFYKENISAAYVNVHKEWSRLSFQAGLRAENTTADGVQTGNPTKPDSSFSQHYNNIFPTGYLQLKLDSAGNHMLNVSYGRRIDRPYYKDLNPFVYIVDKYTNFSGNPFLKPQLSSNYEITYTYKNLFWTTLFYNRYANFQTETVNQVNDKFISTTANVGQKITTGMNATISRKLAKWWDANVYTEVVNFTFTGEVNKEALNTSSTYFYMENSHQLAFGKGWGAELSGFYLSSRTVSQFRLNAKGQLSAGLQKKVLKNKGTLRLNASDIFKTNRASGAVLFIPDVKSSFNNYFDTRLLVLGISYNFSKGVIPKKRATGSSQTEQGRVKN